MIETVMTMCNNLNLSDSEKKMALLRGLLASIKADVIGYNPDSVMATISGVCSGVARGSREGGGSQRF